MKRLLSLLCAFCLVAALFPFTLSASAASTDVINGFHLDADSVTVTDIVPNGWKFSESSTFSKKLGLTNVIESPWDAYGRNSPYILTFTLNSEKDFYFTLDCAASAHNLNVFIEIDGVKKLELSRSGSVDQNDCEKGSLDEALSAGSHTVKVQFSRSGDNNNNKAFTMSMPARSIIRRSRARPSRRPVRTAVTPNMPVSFAVIRSRARRPIRSTMSM